MSGQAPPVLLFSEDYDELYCQHKGLCGGTVVAPDGARYEVFFMEPVRIAGEVADGRPALVESGLLVVPDITRAAMEAAVQFAWKEGFFDRLKPIPPE